MKTGFKNKIEVKEHKSIKSPWNFDAPLYDERTSCYINAGTHHGVGYTQPVGHKDNPKSTAATLPRDRRKVNTMEDAYVRSDNLPIGIDE